MMNILQLLMVVVMKIMGNHLYNMVYLQYISIKHMVTLNIIIYFNVYIIYYK